MDTAQIIDKNIFKYLNYFNPKHINLNIKSSTASKNIFILGRLDLTTNSLTAFLKRLLQIIYKCKKVMTFFFRFCKSIHTFSNISLA